MDCNYIVHVPICPEDKSGKISAARMAYFCRSTQKIALPWFPPQKAIHGIFGLLQKIVYDTYTFRIFNLIESLFVRDSAY